MAKNALRTEICDMLGIKYPIILAGMGDVAGPSLTAAVSNAGGLGVLGGALLEPEEMRQWIRRTRSFTKKPFGVDLLLPASLPESGGEEEFQAELPAQQVAYIEKLKKEIGVPDVKSPQRAGFSADLARKQAQVIYEEHVPVFAFGLGSPKWMIDDAHAHGMKVIGVVGNVKNARRVAQSGVDIVVAQGHEAGGHTGRIGTMALLPQVVDAVSPLPVVAAGGIADGRGLVAALALGAAGVWVGTAFIATREACLEYIETGIEDADSIELWKKKVLEATEEDTRVSRVYTGKTSRYLNNKLIETWLKDNVPTLPFPHQLVLLEPLLADLRAAHKTEYLSGFAGQIVGMIKEMKSGKQVVDDMVNGAKQILENKLCQT